MKTKFLFITFFVFCPFYLMYCQSSESKKTDYSQIEKEVENKQSTDHTHETGVIRDERDGNVYKWVKIGNQVWMAENLNFVTESRIPRDTKSWYYDDDKKNGEKYGRLYHCQTALNVCPTGWHLPSDEEWTILEQTVSNEQNGDKNIVPALLKGGYVGFNVQFGGRHNQGYFTDLEESAYFWTATKEGVPTVYRKINKNGQVIIRSLMGAAYGLSVRCVKNK